eukprot:6186071-Pleurochrysis_carterae.AAC.2
MQKKTNSDREYSFAQSGQTFFKKCSCSVSRRQLCLGLSWCTVDELPGGAVARALPDVESVRICYAQLCEQLKLRSNS